MTIQDLGSSHRLTLPRNDQKMLVEVILTLQIASSTLFHLARPFFMARPPHVPGVATHSRQAKPRNAEESVGLFHPGTQYADAKMQALQSAGQHRYSTPRRFLLEQSLVGSSAIQSNANGHRRAKRKYMGHVTFAHRWTRAVILVALQVPRTTKSLRNQSLARTHILAFVVAKLRLLLQMRGLFVTSHGVSMPSTGDYLLV